jgi:hypothetical protein
VRNMIGKWSLGSKRVDEEDRKMRRGLKEKGE